MQSIVTFIKRLTRMCLQSLHRCFINWTKPDTTPSLMVGTLTDLGRRQVRTCGRKRASPPAIDSPQTTSQTTGMYQNRSHASGASRKDGSNLETSTVDCSGRRRSCGGIARDARLFWKYKSRAASLKPKVSEETVTLIKEIAAQNRLWGAERIRGELLKLGIRVCKRTIQKYMRHARSPRLQGQTWATFLQNHAQDIWACDFLQVTDLFFRSLFAFFIIDMHSRRVIHVGVTRSPTDAWTAHQLREATPYGQSPKYLIRDRDGKFGSCFARVADTFGIKMLTTPDHAPRANAICERFLGSVRRECLDHLFIFQEKQLDRVLHAYVKYFNRSRPHQGIKQQIPEQSGEPVPADHAAGKILSFPVLGGLHHDYRRSA